MTFWTPERKEEAARLWREGRSASQIASVLDCSREAVLGLAWRNRALFPRKTAETDDGRGTPRKPGRPSRRAKQAWQICTISTPKVTAEPAIEPAEPLVPFAIEGAIDIADPPQEQESSEPSNPRQLVNLGNDHCRWPLWETGDSPGHLGLYCGEPVDGVSSYCRHHRMRARAS